MDEIALVKLAVVRSKIAAIPAKLLIAILIMECMYWHFSWDIFKENMLTNIGITIIVYGIISYFWLCIKLTHNWLVGVIFAVILFFIFMSNLDKMGNTASAVITVAICFGGPVLDVFYIIRYFCLRHKLIKQSMNTDGYYESYDADESGDNVEDNSEYDEKSSTASGSPGFFFGCNDENSIKRRYKELCKVYHPDSGNGSAEVFARITDEYNRLIAQYNN